MEFQVWWLILFPIMFGLGWLAARVDIKYVLADSRLLPKQYFESVNHLLNNDNDKAVEILVDIARHHHETIELQFALGHLFRRKGELERAIRIHQKMLMRPELTPFERQSTQYELAMDFMKAGLFDRAEELFTQLSDSDLTQSALNHLLNIYQHEKDWLRAVAVAQQLRTTSYAYQHEIAEFYCELAAQAMTRSQPAQAENYLNQALSEHRKCVRANLLLGDLAESQNKLELALTLWQRIESQDYHYLPFAAPKLLQVYDKLGRTVEGTTLVKGWLDIYPDIDLRDIVFERLMQVADADTAVDFLRQKLRLNPSIAGYLRLLASGAIVSDAQDISSLCKILFEQSRHQLMYHCANCGFKAKQYFWHCPACNKWESFSPTRGQSQPALLHS